MGLRARLQGALWDSLRKDSRDELIFIRLIDKVGGSTPDAKMPAIDESRSASPLGVGRNALLVPQLPATFSILASNPLSDPHPHLTAPVEIETPISVNYIIGSAQVILCSIRM